MRPLPQRASPPPVPCCAGGLWTPLPVEGCERGGCSGGLGCMRTKGSSTDTSLFRQEGGGGQERLRGGGEWRGAGQPPPDTHPPRDTTSFTLTR